MASTVSNAKLTVILKEEVKLNNNSYGNRNSVEIGSVNEVSQRIFTIPTTDTTAVLVLSDSVGAGTYGVSTIKYARVTNLDNTNFVRLSFISSSATPTDFNRYDVRLDARQSYIFTNAKMSGSDNGDSFGSFVNFTSLKAKADTAAVDIELFFASS
jgi:hypothetical protein